LSFKAILRSISAEYLGELDAGIALEIVKDKFPDWFSFTLRSIPRDLKKKGLAMYGYEAEHIPASDIFSKEDAEEALRQQKRCLKQQHESK